MAGAVIASPGITVGMVANTATAIGVTVNSMVTGVRTVNVVNGMRVAEVGVATAVAGTMDAVAVDMNIAATVAIAADIATN